GVAWSRYPTRPPHGGPGAEGPMPGIRWAAVVACLVAPAVLPAQELTPGTEFRVDAARSEIAWELESSLRGVHSRTRQLSGTARVVDAGEDGGPLGWALATH